MEKFYSICLILLLSLGSHFTSEIFAQDVLFISKYSQYNIEDSDKKIKERLESLGLTVHLKGSSGNLPVASDADGKDLVIVSATIYSGNVNSIFKDVTIPVLVLEPYIFDDMKMTESVEDTDFGEKKDDDIDILDPNHYIALQSNLSGKIDVLKDKKYLNWGVPSNDADLVAKVSSGKYCIFVYEQGDNMIGMTAPALRVGFFFGYDAAKKAKSDGWKLFDNTVNYCLQASSCDDVDDPGRIAGDQSECESFDPGRIISIDPASGTGGTIEYRWLKSTSGPVTIENGTEIPNSNSEFYDPPATTETTWYMRLAKGGDCSSFTQTSNVIAKAVTNCGDGQPQAIAPMIPYSQCNLEAYSPGNHAFYLVLNGDYSKTSYVFGQEGGMITYYDNGTAHVTGKIHYKHDSDKKWHADIWFKNLRNWDKWSDMGRSYKAGGGSLMDTWDYYELDEDRSMLIGLEDNEGEILYLTHNPADYTYGLQIGEGANDKNGDYGMSCWFLFTSNTGHYSGHGDINTVNACENICNPQATSMTADLDAYQTGHHAVWLVTSGWSTNFDFDPEGGKIVTYPDGTAQITGNIFNKTNPANRWAIDVRLINKRDWETWSSLGRSYKNGGLTNNHEDWDYYEVDNNNSYFIGLGVNAGSTIAIRHDPGDYEYGFQVGYGANDKNGNFGMSGWLSFSGAKNGYGDFNMNINNHEESYQQNATWVCTGSSWDNNSGFAFDFSSYQVGGINFNEFEFDDKGALITTYFGNNAHISGTILHPSNPNLQWEVSLWLKNKKDWSAWQADGGTYNYTGSNQAIAEDHFTFWDYYELDATRSVMIGRGTHQDDSLFLSQSSASFTHGFQLGIAANGKTDAFGFSGWFDYTSHSGDFSGQATMNLSLDCEEYCAACPRISSKVFLEGAFNANTQSMENQLNQMDVIPLKNPYTASPWNYPYEDSVEEIPGSNIVDWILVEARKRSDSTHKVNEKVGFLTTDGNIVDLDGKSYLELELGDNTEEYFFVIRHRNHLAVMTNSPRAREGRVYFEDFTVSMDKAYSNISITNTPLKVSTSGDLVMVSGDANGNGGINAVDLGMMISQYFMAGYLGVDVTLNSVSNSVDLFRSITNYFYLTHVPDKSN